MISQVQNSEQINPAQYINLADKIKSFALDLGFDLFGIAPAKKSKSSIAYLKKWLAEGKNADMKWMKKFPERRADPQKLLPGAKSIICLAVNYYTLNSPLIHKDKVRIARYAWCRNYHKIIEKRVKLLKRFIKSLAPDAILKSYVDTGSLLERYYAAQAGLGFIGKNTCLITREFGSYVFLAEIITNLKLPFAKFAGKRSLSHMGALSCGTCNRCIKACPTEALSAPYAIDSRKCIAYLTIESRGKIPRNLKSKISPWIFGCDICQEVCPHNIRAKPTKNTDFALAPILKKLTLKQLSAVKTEEEFKKLLAGTSLIRAKFKGIKNNLMVI